MPVITAGTSGTASKGSHLTQICYSAATVEEDANGCMAELSKLSPSDVARAGSFLLDASLVRCGRPENVTARRADGTALPSWLMFDEEALRFSAIDPPPGSLPMPVELTVRWPGGKKAAIRTLLESCTQDR
ncbi:hypothetical protein SAMN06265795_1431 [Noviherbaspirillum humi]|uniref:Uncharacterized protein n=1 Tax=Noviherbaspirillum humi TaxID=1688639 RepID=A0A239MB56_9BURK|nr:hypothetical protein SAMN06265795_1431 [Noviherbaspirillum humi]